MLHREEAWVEGRMESSALDIDKEGETRPWSLLGLSGATLTGGQLSDCTQGHTQTDAGASHPALSHTLPLHPHVQRTHDDAALEHLRQAGLNAEGPYGPCRSGGGGGGGASVSAAVAIGCPFMMLGMTG